MKDGPLFDFWSLMHAAYWFAIVAWISWFVGGLRWQSAALVVAVGSWAWEVVEVARERHFGYQPEPALNRLVGDPISNFVGGMGGWALAAWAFS